MFVLVMKNCFTFFSLFRFCHNKHLIISLSHFLSHLFTTLWNTAFSFIFKRCRRIGRKADMIWLNEFLNSLMVSWLNEEKKEKKFVDSFSIHVKVQLHSDCYLILLSISIVLSMAEFFLQWRFGKIFLLSQDTAWHPNAFWKLYDTLLYSKLKLSLPLKYRMENVTVSNFRRFFKDEKFFQFLKYFEII